MSTLHHIKVRPLEWLPAHMGYAAANPFGDPVYWIHIDSVGQVFVSTKLPGFRNYWPDVTSAKAAVQEDFERRIRSALEMLA